jgi:hypothetical protein
VRRLRAHAVGGLFARGEGAPKLGVHHILEEGAL